MYDDRGLLDLLRAQGVGAKRAINIVGAMRRLHRALTDGDGAPWDVERLGEDGLIRAFQGMTAGRSRSALHTQRCLIKRGLLALTDGQAPHRFPTRLLLKRGGGPQSAILGTF